MLNEYRDILTPEELARALGISRKSAYQLLHDGIIGSKRIGKKYLVPKICVLDYINPHATQSIDNSRLVSERSNQ